jgi:hypothetical protein
MPYTSFEAILTTLDTLTGAQLLRIQREIERIMTDRDVQRDAALPDDAVPTASGYLRQEYAKCGKERCKKCSEGQGHGPYWFRYVYKKGGGHRREYVGKEKPAS